MAGVETTMEELSAIAKAMDSGKSLEEARSTIAPPEAKPEKPESETQADPPPELGQPESNGEPNPSSGGESSLTEKTEPKEPDVSREAKEMERKMRSWSSLNAEKEKHQQRVDEFDQRQEKWKLQQMESTNELRDEEGYSAKDYDKVEAEFREDGEGKLADDAKASAEALRESERVTAEKLLREQSKQDFSKTFSDNYAAARENYPDLGNHDSELFKRTEQVFLHYPQLLGDADGPRKAAWVASRDILATQTESFRDENQRLTNELEEYKSKLSIGGSQPAPRPATKEFMDMDTDARFKMLTDQAAQMDKQSG